MATYQADHPGAVEATDHGFRLYRLRRGRPCGFVGGFARMSWVDAQAYTAAEPDPLTPHVAGIVEHMNADHGEAMVLYCQILADRPATVAARMTGIDRYGFTMLATDEPRRPRTRRAAGVRRAVDTPTEARKALVALVQEAAGEDRRRAGRQPRRPRQLGRSGDHFLNGLAADHQQSRLQLIGEGLRWQVGVGETDGGSSLRSFPCSSLSAAPRAAQPDAEWCAGVRAELDHEGVGWPVANRPLDATQLDAIRNIFSRAGRARRRNLRVAATAWTEGYDARFPTCEPAMNGRSRGTSLQSFGSSSSSPTSRSPTCVQWFD